MDRRFVADFFLQRKKRFRLEIAERKIFQFVADQAHSKPVRDGRVNVERFACDALLLRRVEKLERAHVVQAVGEFDEHDANVVHHGEHHLANGLGLARFGRHHFEAADFCDAFDEMGDFGAETLGDARNGKLGVFDDVVQQRGGQRRGVQAHVGEDVRDFQQMHEIRFAGTCGAARGGARRRFHRRGGPSRGLRLGDSCEAWRGVLRGGRRAGARCGRG